MSETPDTTESLATAPGQILKRARENKNLTVAAIATLMNLDLRTVEALERGDQSKLPAPIFVRGYLRGYARLVGVSEAAVLEAYQAQAPQEPMPRAVGLSKVPVRPAFRAPALPWRGLLLAVVALVAVWLGIQWGPQLIARLTGDATPETADGMESGMAQPEVVEPAAPTGAMTELPIVATPPTETVETQTSETQTSELPSTETGRVDLPLPAPSVVPSTAPSNERGQPVVKPEPASLPGDTDFGPAAGSGAADTAAPHAEQTTAAAGEMRLELRASDDSWVEVHAADGSKLVIDLLHKGETRSVAGKAPLSVLLGNAASVEIRVDGKPFDHRRYDRDNIARFEIGRKP